jgi:hypothetical protein
MNRKLALLLTIALLLSACGSPATPSAPTKIGPAQTSPTSAPGNATAASQSSRTATFTELTGAVEAHASQTDAFAPASLGTTLFVGGETRTGTDGKARLDLAPEGTIIRVVPNSSFTFVDLSGDKSSPSSKIKLFFGQIFIILKGGELQVETPSGLASVRGSLLGVSYNPDKKAVTATCLEGHCSLANEEGKTIELESGQAADILDGDISDEARSMTADELNQWETDNPDLNDYIDTSALPDITDEAPTQDTLTEEAPTEEAPTPDGSTDPNAPPP